MGRGWCTSSTFDAGLWESDVKVGGVKTLADNQGGQKDTGETVGGCLIAAIIMLGIAAGMMMFRLVGSTCNSTARCAAVVYSSPPVLHFSLSLYISLLLSTTLTTELCSSVLHNLAELSCATFLLTRFSLVFLLALSCVAH